MNFAQHVAPALQAMSFARSGFSWFGGELQKLPDDMQRRLGAGLVRRWLIATAQRHLYADFYCRGYAYRRTEADMWLQPGTDAAHVAALKAANRGKGCWEDSWKVVDVERSIVAVQRRGMTVWSPRHRLRWKGKDLQRGRLTAVMLPHEQTGMSPGFYIAQSNHSLHSASTRVVRLYWHLTPAGAIQFVTAATTTLNDHDIRFAVKALTDTGAYWRCDSVVLYLAYEDWKKASALMPQLHKTIVGELMPQTPAFAKTLAPGVGLAEDPLNGSSFGMDRCRLLAEGALLAHEQSAESLLARHQIVEEHFRLNGVSPGAPHLRARARDVYSSWPVEAVSPPRFISTRTRRSKRSLGWLEMAAQFGRDLVRSAVWHRRQCTWLGDTFDRTGFVLRLCSVGPDLYSGTAGIGLFLAELAARTGDPAAARCAEGAIRHALGTSGNAQLHLGLHAGMSGVVYSALQAYQALHNDRGLEACRVLAHRLVRAALSESEFDVLYGLSGAVLGLMPAFGKREAIAGDRALKRLGNELIRRGHRAGGALSWKSPTIKARPNLTGFSHGASGAGAALLALFVQTGHVPFRRAAEAAFAYERRWFDAASGNWPDFRGSRSAAAGRDYMAAWCHGAPGITLARLRAAQVLGVDPYQREAEAGLQTTLQTVQNQLRVPQADFTLCHGIAGNADVLLCAATAYGSSAHEQAEEAGAFGIDRYSDGSRPWPCGTPGATPPGLMTGLAGIGYFYLRLHDPTIRSVLAPWPIA